MKIKIDIIDSNFHPEDDINDSWNEKGELNSRCGGYDNFSLKYPGFREWLRNNPPADLRKKNREIYAEYITHIGINALFEIEPIPVENLGAIFLAEAEISFQKLALLVEKKMNTTEEERKILYLKETVIQLSGYKGFRVAYIPQIKEVSPSTQFGIMRYLPENCREYIEDIENKNKVVGCIPIKHRNAEKLYIIIPSVRDISPPLKLGFDGKNFVAVYINNMPQLPESCKLEFLQLPEANTEKSSTSPNNTEERMLSEDSIIITKLMDMIISM